MLAYINRGLLLLCASSILLVGCENSSSPESKKIIAEQHTTSKGVETSAKPSPTIKSGVGQVGKRIFTEKDIDREFSQMPENFQKMKNNAQMRGNILNNIMTRYALTTQAKKEGVNQEEDVQAQLERMEQNILLQALNKQVKSRLKPKEAVINRYYQDHQKDFMVKEQVHVAHILVKDENLANKLYQRLQHGESFAMLAKKYSLDDSSKNKGGDLAPFSKGMMVLAFEKSAFALNKKHNISKPVHTHYGFHIIHLLEHIPPYQKPLAEVKNQILSLLTQKFFQDWVAQVKKEMGVKVLKSSYKMSAPNLNHS